MHTQEVVSKMNDEAIIECDFCKGKIPAKETIVITDDLFKDNKGEQFTYQYFACPHCEHKFVIRIDNNCTRKLQAEYTKMLDHLEDLRKKHIAPKQKQIKKLHKLRRKLDFATNLLSEKYYHLTESVK